MKEIKIFKCMEPNCISVEGDDEIYVCNWCTKISFCESHWTERLLMCGGNIWCCIGCHEQLHIEFPLTVYDYASIMDCKKCADFMKSYKN